MTTLQAEARVPEAGPAPDAPAHDSAPDSGSPPEPLEARVEALPVPGFLDALVSLPASRAREPVIFATHGAGGAPEPHCAAWRARLGQRGIVVCLRGALINRAIGAEAGFYYPNHPALERELEATLTSFEASYRERALPPPYVYTGYSQGATMGALILPAHAETFPVALLVEGGFDEWPLVSARRFAENGGRRAAWVCGTVGCNKGALRSRHAFEQAKVEALTRHAPGAGHTYGGPVAQEIDGAFRWLVDGDARWSQPEP